MSSFPGARVHLRVLGPLEVQVDRVPVALGGVKQRSILALLLTEPNRVVSTARIVNALWGEDAVERAASTLQVHVSNLRKALAPVAAALGIDEFVGTQRPGYVVHATVAELDLLAFRELIAEAQQHVARNDPRAASASYRDALTLVHGEPLADLVDEPFAAPIVAHLQQLVGGAREARFETELMIGNHREVLGEIEDGVARDPLNEHLRALQMIALYRCGRQADALAAYQDARQVLVDELGVDPSPELRELEGRVLAQDRALDPPRPATVDVELRTMLRSSVLIPLARLVLVGQDPDSLLLSGPVTTIGRREGNDVVFDDPQVSRLHAEVRVDGGRFTIVDCQSTNGTRVNGTSVREHTLESGDEITISGHHMRFEMLDR
jgi:DNA-binding SARP family transcriptional activator